MRTLALALALGAGSAQAQTEIAWWHSMGGALGEQLNALAAKFNQGQKEYKVVPVYKGTYPESMTAAIAAFRAGNAPHILQVFEVGTATMMAAKGAIVPVTKLMADANEPFEPKAYLPTVSGYYTDVKGNMLSFPFNSSTVMFYINRDAFRKAGLEPQAPKTWKEFQAAAEKLKSAGQQCVYTTSWPSWTHIENFSAWHNVPIGTKANGLDGFDTELKFNSPLHLKHLQNLIDLQKDKTYDYAGRANAGEARFGSGECAIFLTSSGYYGTAKGTAKFDVKGAPQNSIIGGASLWVMGGKKPQEYKGVAKFFAFLSRPETQMDWHTGTGYVPITLASYELTRKSGYYDKNPGTDMPVKQLTYKPPTPNS
ncbi:MAG: sn-glycerol-3-phosphate ABC transporter substrate-binding protein UgpB, partial [Betaproteobacteria bacterium]